MNAEIFCWGNRFSARRMQTCAGSLLKVISGVSCNIATGCCLRSAANCANRGWWGAAHVVRAVHAVDRERKAFLDVGRPLPTEADCRSFLAECGVVDMDVFWDIVGSALGGDRPTAEALVDRLVAGGSVEAVLDFQECFDAVDTVINRWDVWAAAYVIGHGCSDDSFTDFRAGVIALGRGWFERVAASPDTLADHPAVIAAVTTGGGRPSFDEEFGFACATAYSRLSSDGCSFWDAREARQINSAPAEVDTGENFAFDNPEEMRARLPRLSALFLATR